MRNPPSFSLRPSQQQKRLDGAFLLLSLALLTPLLSFVWLLFCAACMLVAWRFIRKQTISGELSFRAGQWWWAQPALQPLKWRVGSVRRHNLIIWRYGRWPWQRLLIRPDSLPAGQFQQLLRELQLHPL